MIDARAQALLDDVNGKREAIKDLLHVTRGDTERDDRRIDAVFKLLSGMEMAIDDLATLLASAVPADSTAAIVQALKNYGADVECGACMEIAFTGMTQAEHDCPGPREKVTVELASAVPAPPTYKDYGIYSPEVERDLSLNYTSGPERRDYQEAVPAPPEKEQAIEVSPGLFRSTESHSIYTTAAEPWRIERAKQMNSSASPVPEAPQQRQRVQGYGCNQCGRDFFIVAPEEAYACPICRSDQFSELVGPFEVADMLSPKARAPASREQEK